MRVQMLHLSCLNSDNIFVLDVNSFIYAYINKLSY
jgi:hypothetical protein